MAMTECKECKKEISDKAEACPYCGAKRTPKMGFFKALFTLLFAGIGIMVMVGIFMPKGNKVSNGFEGVIHSKVVQDAKDQYDIVQRNGSKIETCVHASVVSAAYVQAKDEAGLQAWKPIEKKDCRAAGMPGH